MSWIKVQNGIGTNKKIARLCSLRKWDKFQTIGFMVSFWVWAAENFDSGEIGDLLDSDVGFTLGLDSPENILSDMEKAGFIDSDKKLHDWGEHQKEYLRSKYQYRPDRLKEVLSLYNAIITPLNSDKKEKKERENTARVNKDNNKGGGRTINPTLAEVQEYCKTKGIPADPVKFWAHYQGVGWKIGAAPIKDWQAVLLKWTTPQVQAPQQTPAAPRAPKMAYDKPAETPIEDPRGWEPLK